MDRQGFRKDELRLLNEQLERELGASMTKRQKDRAEKKTIEGKRGILNKASQQRIGKFGKVVDIKEWKKFLDENEQEIYGKQVDGELPHGEDPKAHRLFEIMKRKRERARKYIEKAEERHQEAAEKKSQFQPSSEKSQQTPKDELPTPHPSEQFPEHERPTRQAQHTLKHERPGGHPDALSRLHQAQSEPLKGASIRSASTAKPMPRSLFRGTGPPRAR